MLASKAVDTRAIKRSLCVPPFQCHVIIEISTVPYVFVFRMTFKDMRAFREPLALSSPLGR
jgi:hypothetical protein